MKTPKLLLACALALISAPAFAQADSSIGLRLPTQKGSWMLGSNLVFGEIAFGSIGHGHGMQGVYNVSLNPRAGYFIKDNLMVGGMVNATFSGNSLPETNYFNRYNSRVVGLGVFARKYFGKATDANGHMARLRFFVEGGVSVNRGWIDFREPHGTVQETFNTGTAHVMPGINYFFTKNIALEGGLYMSHTRGSHNVAGNANRIGINLGLQIFMGKR